MQILAHPFNFNESQPGSFAKLEQESNTHKAQEIAGFTLTHRGERPIYAEFGIDDPAFSDFDETEFAADFALFYNNRIQLVDVNVEEESGAVARISVTFE